MNNYPTDFTKDRPLKSVTTFDTYTSHDFELEGYKRALRDWLLDAKEFRQFKIRVTDAFAREGFSDWAYVRSDVQLDQGVEDLVGTSTQSQLDLYKSEGFANHDFMLRHAAKEKWPIFKSQIDVFLDASPIATDEIVLNRNISRVYSEFGYLEYCAIPLYNEDQDNHAIFTLAARKKTSAEFLANFTTNMEKLKIIINLTESVGIKKYPLHILGSKSELEKITNGRPLMLLKLMAEKDYSIPQAAQAMNMTRTAADKQLAKIRDYLGAQTTHGAVISAINKGLITLKH